MAAYAGVPARTKVRQETAQPVRAVKLSTVLATAEFAHKVAAARSDEPLEPPLNASIAHHYTHHESVAIVAATGLGIAEVALANYVTSALPPLPRAVAFEAPHRLPSVHHVSKELYEEFAPCSARVADRAATWAAGLSPAIGVRFAVGSALLAATAAVGLPIAIASCAAGLRTKDVPASLWPGHNAFAHLRTLEYPQLQASPSRTHTHPGLAAARHHFYGFATAVADHLAGTVYDVQAAWRTITAGQNGSPIKYCRYPVSQKDPNVYHCDPVGPSDVFIDVDVGYYLNGTLDMKSGYAALLGTGRPVIAWAISPRCVPYHSPECSIVWVGPHRPGHVRMEVTGTNSPGAYEHELWDLDTDLVQTTALGYATLSKVTSRQLAPDDPHRAYVMVPEKYQPATSAPLDNTLRRFVPLWVGPICVVREDRPLHDMPQGITSLPVVRVSVMLCAHSYFCSHETWVQACSRAEAMRQAAGVPTPSRLAADVLTLSASLASKAVLVNDPACRINNRGVDGTLDDHGKAIVKIICQALLDPAGFHTAMGGGLDRAYLPHTTDTVTSGFKLKASSVGELGGPGPVLSGGMFPAHCSGNARVCIQTRVLNVTNASTGPRNAPRLADEFAKLVADDARLQESEHLRSVFDVLDQQARPAQISAFVNDWPLLQDAMLDAVYPSEVRAFQKNEAYAKCGDPRNISTTSTAIRIAYSMFTLAIAAQLKKTVKWYAFGYHPDVLCQAISDRLERTPTGHAGRSWCMSVDYSRFDGRISTALNDATRRAMKAILRLLNPAANDFCQFDALVSAHANCRASQGDVSYNTGSSRLSGSPETSLANSLANAFISYCSLRASGLSPQQAYDSLGFYGGDDSLVPVPDHMQGSPAAFARLFDDTARDFGMDTKSTVSPTDAVAFLGRYYYCDPGVAGNLGPWRSIADVPRQLRKLDINCSGLTPMQSCLAKALGLAHTDASTPVLRNWANAVATYAAAMPEPVRLTAAHALPALGFVTQWALADEYAPDDVIDPQTVLNKLALAPPPDQATFDLVNELLDGEIDAFISTADGCMNFGTRQVIYAEDLPGDARSYYTKLGGPPEICKLSSAKLGRDVPIALSFMDMDKSVTAGRITSAVVRGYTHVVDVFGGPGAFAAVASHHADVTSYVLPSDAQRHAALVMACGNQRTVTYESAHASPPDHVAYTLPGLRSAGAGCLVYLDPPWANSVDRDAVSDVLICFVADNPACFKDRAVLLNADQQEAERVVRSLSAAHEDRDTPIAERPPVHIVSHEPGKMTPQTLVFIGHVPQAVPAAVLSARLAWNAVQSRALGFTLNPLMPDGRYVDEKDKDADDDDDLRPVPQRKSDHRGARRPPPPPRRPRPARRPAQ